MKSLIQSFIDLTIFGAVIKTQELAKIICEAIIETKALNISIIDVHEQPSCGEYLILCNGMATRQVRAVAENVLHKIKSQCDLLPLGVEGRGLDQWVVVDYGFIIIHIFQPEMREYYDLDGLWLNSPRIPLSDLGIEYEEQEPSEESLEEYSEDDFSDEGSFDYGSDEELAAYAAEYAENSDFEDSESDS